MLPPPTSELILASTLPKPTPPERWPSAPAHVVLLFLVCLGAAACLPGKRDNAPPANAADGVAGDGVNPDAVAGDGGVDGAGQDAASHDGVVGDASLDTSADDAATDTQTIDAGPVQLPKGCTRDADCDVPGVGQCAVATCDLGSGLCELSDVAKGTPCSLPDVCVTQTTCDGGACTGADTNCDDGNSCTTDLCFAFEGCVHKAAMKICNDGDPCTLADACTQSTCVGIVRDCTALNPCLAGFCNTATGDCGLGDATAGTSCDDNNVCTASDGCDGKGNCVGTALNPAKDCDDKNPCTQDICDPAKPGGCDHIAVAGPQSCDGDPCTDDACNAGKCVSTKVDCDDFKPCTQDACKAAANGTDPECSYVKLNKGDCADSEPCAEEATCVDGACKVSKPKVCDDGNPCTKDSCLDKAGGCLYLDQLGPCNDGSGCTTEDTCKAGKCAGKLKDCADGDACTLDKCDPVTAKCENPLAPEGYVCGTDKVCKLGSCKAGT